MYQVLQKKSCYRNPIVLAGPFATEKEAQTARRAYCLEVRGRESYRRQTRTWVTNQIPSAPPAGEPKEA